jgi:hypothetical protein
VNIRPLVPAAMMTGSTILVKVLMVVLLFCRRLSDGTQYAILRIRRCN